MADAVEAFLHHLAVERGSAANTLRSYTGDLHRYLEHLGDRDLAEVRTADVTAFVAALRDADPPLAASSTARAAGRRARAAPLRRARRDRRRGRRPRRHATRAAAAAAAHPHHRRGGAAPRGLRRETVPSHCATGRCWSCSTRRARGSPRPSGSTSTTSTTTSASSGCTARGARTASCRWGGPRLASVDAYRVRARPDLARRGRGCPALFVNARGARLSRQSAWHVLSRMSMFLPRRRRCLLLVSLRVLLSGSSNRRHFANCGIPQPDSAGALPCVRRIRRHDVTGPSSQPSPARDDHYCGLGHQQVPLLNRISRRVSAAGNTRRRTGSRP